MHGNAHFHSVMVTQAFLDIESERLITRPPASPDLNHMENLWFIIKQNVYTVRR